MDARQTILVVDDEEMIAEAVCSYLESRGYAVIVAHCAEQALELFAREPVSLVILDLMLPDLPGEEVCRRLRRSSRVPIIMLTAKVEEEDQVQGLGLGADDFVTKPFSLRALHARVEAVLRRAHAQPPDKTLRFGELSIAPAERLVRLGARPVDLTPKEYRLLLTMASHRGKVFTREELVALSLGEEFDGFDRTVDSHIKNLRRKLKDNPKKPRYILTVHGVGYRFGGED